MISSDRTRLKDLRGRGMRLMYYVPGNTGIDLPQVFPKGFFHLQSDIHRPVELLGPLILIGKICGMRYKDPAGFLVWQFSPVELHAYLCFDLRFMRVELMEQVFIIRNIPFYYELLILADLIYADMTSRRTNAQGHPVVCACLSLVELLCKQRVLECIVIESDPIVISSLPCRRITCTAFDLFCPVIWLFYHLKFNSDIRAADLVQLDLYQEEGYILIGVIVEPFDS